jgi:hypothetical protein
VRWTRDVTVFFYSFHVVQCVCLCLGTPIAGVTEDREIPCWGTVKCRVLVAGRHDVLEYNKGRWNNTYLHPDAIKLLESFSLRTIHDNKSASVTMLLLSYSSRVVSERGSMLAISKALRTSCQRETFCNAVILPMLIQILPLQVEAQEQLRESHEDATQLALRGSE